MIFDLDGTLYEDTHHFDYYASRLQARLTSKYKIHFWNDYLRARNGHHPLKIGTIYDVRQDLILQHEHLAIKNAFRWDSSKLKTENLASLYSMSISIDQKHYISIGDLWWLPAAISRHFGLSVEGARKAFLETRNYMMSNEFVMTKDDGFRHALKRLKEQGLMLVLLTNSPETDSEVLLSKLDLRDLFDVKIFEGQKPTHTIQHFNEIKEHFQVEYGEMLSIGDNLINEIQPAKELGCRTIFIDPHEIGQRKDADIVVQKLAELIFLLKKYAPQKL